MSREALGEAVDWLRSPPFACACVTDGPSCCWRYAERARALRRAAHVAVKLMADRRDRMALGES